nr:beta-ketoacyl synthase N-terminal-like domain-containing protein [Gilvimarinus xylanilyticus]
MNSLLERAQLSRTERRRTALLMGSSSFDVHISESQYRRELNTLGPEQALPMPIVGYGKIAQHLADQLALGPHRYAYSTACTSSANALLYAARLLQQDQADHALVLGCEHLNATSALGFYGLGLISPRGEMAPFDARRDGLILGEGTGALLLSKPSQTPASERRWQLAGGAIGTDNYSLTAAHVSGKEIAKVIRAALADADITAADIAAIKLHGTASLLNDEAEAAALHQVFATLPQGFALKPYVGHTLGACGALETALTLGSLARGTLPDNPRALGDGELAVPLLKEKRPAQPGYYLLNCFAFGGNNNALIIRDQGANE